MDITTILKDYSEANSDSQINITCGPGLSDAYAHLTFCVDGKIAFVLNAYDLHEFILRATLPTPNIREFA